jgi:tetratricopeptide (TPR) repeat protein
MSAPGDRRDDTAPATGLVETPGDHGFPPGTPIGRYVLRERLGAGGMGVVYAAEDPKLGRSVALKLLRPDASGREDAQRQLLREAQTLARLAHPNVVSVHDIGEIEEHVFVAMELVKGGTLAQWLAAERSLPEVLGVFVQAGRGLAAAHALGIVHRDSKPDNVLVGDDGRVRVVDFGIALLAPQAAGPQAASHGEVSAEAPAEQGQTTAPPVTRTNARAGSRTGTPRYMAPEHRRDGTTDVRSDQYSYCVALREAVSGHGGRPPRWLEQAIERGLATVPEERHASMDALLDVLASEPRRRRRLARTAATAAAAIGLLAAGAVWGSVRNRATPAPLCRGAEAKLAGAWDDGRKASIEKAFLATAKPFSPAAWRGVQATLDAYTREWVAQRTDACEATRVRGEQSDQLLGLRMACLDERLTAMSALTTVFASADEGVVAHAFSAVQALPRLAPCADGKGLMTKGKPAEDAETAAKVAALATRLAQVKALDDAGKYRDALALAEPLAAEAEGTGDRRLQAASLYMQGSLLGRTGDLTAAEQALRRAASAADAAGDDATRVQAWGALLFYVAGQQGKFDQIPALREQATAALTRLGANDEVEAELQGDLGAALLAAGKLDEAREVDEKADALEVRVFGKGSWQESIALENLGIACAVSGKSDQAIELETRALAIDEAQLGPEHPFVASAENTIAGALNDKGDIPLAEQHARRAVEIAEGSVSDEDLSRFVFDLGEIFTAEHKLADALTSYQRALALASKAHREDDPVLWEFLVRIGDTHRALGDPASAASYLKRALAIPGAGEQPDAARVTKELAEMQAKAKGKR